MNIHTLPVKRLIAVVIATTLVAACSSMMKSPEGSAAVRAKLTQLQSDPELSSRAPVAIKTAEEAVRAAEVPRKDKELAKHLVYLADRKVDIASGLAQTRWEEDQQEVLSDQRADERLESRTREADMARDDATYARNDAEMARNDAEIAHSQADMARQQTADMAKQLAELNAKETERGLVITLGDVLFDTGKSNLKGNATTHLAKLSVFLNQYQNRTLIIEGHTDSMGSEDSNAALSQRRADSVKSYLLGQGVAAARVNTYGKGEGSPIASNDNAAGRQLNRRVEVIIAK